MKAIVAMDPNRVIGNNGNIPWHIPEDFKWFKRVTMGIPYERAINIPDKIVLPEESIRSSVVVGRKTYEKTGVLPGRYHYILTNDPEKLKLPITSVARYLNLKELMEATIRWHTMWVIGGASVYELLMPQCIDIFVTHVHEEYDGDAYMMEFKHLFTDQELLRETKEYSIVRYWRTVTIL